MNATSGTGYIVLTDPNNTNAVTYSSLLAIEDASTIKVSGNVVPTSSNVYTLGTTGQRWKDVFIGPGSLNVQGPTGSPPGLIGSNVAGTIYTENGLATPYINVGPSITPDAIAGAVGGWHIYATGTNPPVYDDLVAQLIRPDGKGYTGSVYSLLGVGPTGPQGPAATTNNFGFATLYFNADISANDPSYVALGPTLQSSTLKTYTSTTSGTQLLASFATSLDYLLPSSIPAGIWTFDFYASSQQSDGRTGIYFEIYSGTYDVPGTTVLISSLIGTNVANFESITNSSPDLHSTSVSVNKKDLPNLGIRAAIIIKVYSIGVQGNKNVSVYFEGSLPGYVNTSFPAVLHLPQTTTTSAVVVYDVSSNILQYNTSKTFVIDHPRDPSKYLVHACLEGPEAGVYYRGRGQVTNNASTVVVLPDYVASLATDLTVQVTAIYDGKARYYTASEVEDNRFTVYGENGKFYWLVMGQRSHIEVEPSKNAVTVRGDGPYTYLA
jgi:hypothetical protein